MHARNVGSCDAAGCDCRVFVERKAAPAVPRSGPFVKVTEVDGCLVQGASERAWFAPNGEPFTQSAALLHTVPDQAMSGDYDSALGLWVGPPGRFKITVEFTPEGPC